MERNQLDRSVRNQTGGIKMNNRDMEVRLRNGESRLETSIEKWRQIVDGEADLHSGIFPGNCALCDKYIHLDCSGCPLEITGEKCTDTGSIWSDFNQAVTYENNDLAMTYAQYMLDKLQSLRLQNETEDKR